MASVPDIGQPVGTLGALWLQAIRALPSVLLLLLCAVGELAVGYSVGVLSLSMFWPKFGSEGDPL